MLFDGISSCLPWIWTRIHVLVNYLNFFFFSVIFNLPFIIIYSYFSIYTNFHMFKYINIFLTSSNSYHSSEKNYLLIRKDHFTYKMYLKYTYIFLVQYRNVYYVITHFYLHYRIFIMHTAFDYLTESENLHYVLCKYFQKIRWNLLTFSFLLILIMLTYFNRIVNFQQTNKL